MSGWLASGAHIEELTVLRQKSTRPRKHAPMGKNHYLLSKGVNGSSQLAQAGRHVAADVSRTSMCPYRERDAGKTSSATYRALPFVPILQA